MYAGVKSFIHISALSASPDSTSEWSRSKFRGEQAVREAFPEAVRTTDTSYIHTYIHTYCIYTFIHTYIRTYIHTVYIHSYILYIFIHTYVQIHTYRYIHHIVYTYKHKYTQYIQHFTCEAFNCFQYCQ